MSWFEFCRLRVLGLSCEEIVCGLYRTGPWFVSFTGAAVAPGAVVSYGR